MKGSMNDIWETRIRKEKVQKRKEKNLKNFKRKATYIFMQKIICPKCNKVMGGTSSTSKNKEKHLLLMFFFTINYIIFLVYMIYNYKYIINTYNKPINISI